MEEIIDQNYRQAQLNDPYAKMLEGMPREDKIALRDQLLAKKKSSMITGMLNPLINTSAQYGGIKPTEQPKDTSSDLNDFMMKEMIKAKFRQKPSIITPTETSTPEELPAGLWRDPETRKLVKLPMQTAEGKPTVSVAQQKFDLAQEEAKKKNEFIAKNVQDSATDALNTIGEVEKGINHFGIWGDLPSIGGTPRAKWEANVNKLLSGKVIDVMTKMKEASKTGATGFGQLSEKELKVLQEASTALKRKLSPGDAQAILNDMKLKLQKIAGLGLTPMDTVGGGTKYQVGQIINTPNGDFVVTGGDLNNDPDVDPVR